MARPRGRETGEDFEKSMQKLEEIVRRLEEDEISLEVSLKLYEEGLALQRACERKLQDAENRIKQLVENRGGDVAEEDFEAEDDREGAPGEPEPPAPETAPATPQPEMPPAQPPSGKLEDDLPF